MLEEELGNGTETGHEGTIYDDLWFNVLQVETIATERLYFQTIRVFVLWGLCSSRVRIPLCGVGSLWRLETIWRPEQVPTLLPAT